MEIYFGEYGFFKNQLLRIEIENGRQKFITTDASFMKEGFRKCGNISYCFPINNTNNFFAYNVITFCLYKGEKCQLLATLTNSKFRVGLLEGVQIIFKDFPKHGYAPIYEATENEISDIWEERTPIEGFKFDVEPIVYLKKDGVWLVEH